MALEATIYVKRIEASDIYTNPLSKNRTATSIVALSDNILVIFARATTDVVAISDSIALTRGRELVDSVGVSDTFTYTVAYSRLVTDSITLNDGMRVNEDVLGARTDIFAVSDINSWEATKGVTDSLGTFSESISFVRGRDIEDSVGASDIFTRTVEYDRVLVGDSVALLELISNNPIKNITDPLGTFSETVDILRGRGILDSLGMSDTLTILPIGYSRSITDSITLDDGMRVGPNVLGTRFNFFAVSDVNSWGVTKSVTDTVVSSDFAVSVVDKDIEDSVGTSDTSNYQLTAQYTDSVAITELISIDLKRGSSVLNTSALNVAILNS